MNETNTIASRATVPVPSISDADAALWQRWEAAVARTMETLPEGFAVQLTVSREGLQVALLGMSGAAVVGPVASDDPAEAFVELAHHADLMTQPVPLRDDVPVRWG